ncbi:hypothetical protein N431DRAFT_472469 [Stipitochalara longipes BDJ]|nr:hypothetical protein N431DRAFT_472469 [Stipitochalara longipes BDJ]
MPPNPLIEIQPAFLDRSSSPKPTKDIVVFELHRKTLHEGWCDGRKKVPCRREAIASASTTWIRRKCVTVLVEIEEVIEEDAGKKRQEGHEEETNEETASADDMRVPVQRANGEIPRLVLHRCICPSLQAAQPADKSSNVHRKASCPSVPSFSQLSRIRVKSADWTAIAGEYDELVTLEACRDELGKAEDGGRGRFRRRPIIALPETGTTSTIKDG